VSGIVGIWNLDGSPVDRELLKACAGAIDHRGPDGRDSWIEGPAGMIFQHLRVTPESLDETQPLVGESGPVVVFDGRLDDREELLAGLPKTAGLNSGSADAALVLAAYEAFGERFVDRLAGDFALALFDPRSPHLLLARDSLGVRPLYYHRTRRRIVFASEIKPILAAGAPARPNDDFLAQFILREFVGDEPGATFFDGIPAVPPSHVIRVDPRKAAVRMYWDFDPNLRIVLGSENEYARSFMCGARTQ
jgi:asparagine synthase (glutamine-hydrolysing)